MNKLKKYLRVLAVFAASGILSFLILICQPNLSNLIFIENSFLINFLGVLLGVSITLITYIYSVVSQMVEKHKNNERIVIKVRNLYKELKDNASLIFWLLIGALVLTIWASVDLPIFNCVKLFNIEKIYIIVWIKLNIMILSLVGIKDIIDVLFVIININLDEKD